MGSSAISRNQSIHPTLVVFPIGLLVCSLVCDLVYHLLDRAPVWDTLAWYTMAGGVAGAALAAIPGLIDFLTIRESRIRRLGLMHMSLSLLMAALFALNAWLRTQSAPGATAPFVLSIAGTVFLVLSAWLGGELVYVRRLRVSRPLVQSARRAASRVERAGPSWEPTLGDRRMPTRERRRVEQHVA
jgi:uncharacterized membrane protein